MIRKCPECGTVLHHAQGLAVWCPNDACPVRGCPDCWDGKGNYTPPPKIKFQVDSVTSKIAKLQRQRNILLDALKRISRQAGEIGEAHRIAEAAVSVY